jgi:hypothetical protein
VKFVQSILIAAALTLAPALAADEPSLGSWQKSMNSGCKLMNNNKFAEAQTQFEAAVTIADQLKNDEAQFFALDELAGALCEQGKYQDAQSSLQRSAAFSDGEAAFDRIASLLEKQNKFDEANALRKQHYVTKAERKAGSDAIPKIQAAIRKEWKVKGLLASAWTVVIFRVPSKASERAIYISDSSGDPSLERASIKALLNAALPQQFPGLKSPAAVRFTFTYNAHSGFGFDDISEQGKFAIQAHQYRLVRDRLAEEEKLFGDEHLECLSTMLAAADLLQGTHKQEAAETAYRHVIDVCQAKGWNCSYLVSAKTKLGNVLINQKKFAEAEQQLRQAKALKDALYRPDAYVEPDPTPLLAEALLKLHRDGEAKQLLSASGGK